jgi:hypothetical protein
MPNMAIMEAILTKKIRTILVAPQMATGQEVPIPMGSVMVPTREEGFA